MSGTRPRYAELHAHSAFTFLDGTCEPAEMVRAAQGLGLEALAVLDVDGMHSAVRTTMAAREAGLPIVHGSELTIDASSLRPALPGAGGRGWGLRPGAHDPGVRLPVLAASPQGYSALVSAMSDHALSRPGRRDSSHRLDDLSGRARDWLVLTGSGRGPLRRALRSHGTAGARRVLDSLVDLFGRDAVVVEVQRRAEDGPEEADALAGLARTRGLRLVATTGARMAGPASQALGDVLAAARLGMGLDEAEGHLAASRSFLRGPEEMALIHADHPGAVAASADIAREAAFDLRLVAPRLPRTRVPGGHTPDSWLARLAHEGARERYGDRGESPGAWRTIDHELEVIASLGFAGYFLIVKEIVDFCSAEGILCQGRGSAANSAVCYCLGITAVDAVRHQLLFERFLSSARSGPPDIDIDIESGRREEVIQHVYDTYGRHRAAQVANVITYRPRSAIRDAARALGHSQGQAAAWSRGEAPAPPLVARAAEALAGLPRHMGIHPGGMVLTDQPVSSVCPISWGSVPGRSVLQWDKEDCEDAGLVKFDLLGLGMLSALRLAFDRLAGAGAPEGEPWGRRSSPLLGRRGLPIGLHTLPQEDPGVYDLLCAADTVGVFQVESRAQMSTLPRLKPRCFYDIVVEVALIRPGPIQGGSVNPFLRRRAGEEEVSYLHPLLEPALAKTLGVPLFQEQLMRIAADAAGFTPAQADRLRRALGAKRGVERVEGLRPALMEGMGRRGIDAATGAAIVEQLKGFADFGFPESHAFSFAHIVYASAWLKLRAPEHFYAALLACQPMGFYSPSSLVHDARRHGVRVAPPDVNHSRVGAVVEEADEGEGGVPRAAEPVPQAVPLDVDPRLAVRIGLGSIAGLGAAAERTATARGEGPYSSVGDLARRARLGEKDLERLAHAGALASLGASRREGMWSAGALGAPRGPVGADGGWQPALPGIDPAPAPDLPAMDAVEELRADTESTGLTTGDHPFALVRAHLDPGVLPVSALHGCDDGAIVSVAGLITHRQRPPTAAGTVFLTLEDESGMVNVTCAAGMWAAHRAAALRARAVEVRGRLERRDGAVGVRAHSLREVAAPVAARSRDFR